MEDRFAGQRINTLRECVSIQRIWFSLKVSLLVNYNVLYLSDTLSRLIIDVVADSFINHQVYIIYVASTASR